jgi:Bor protein
MPDQKPRPQLSSRALRAGLFVAMCALSGCFHTIVTTGLPAGPDIITRPWASSFLFGLVPPDIVNGAATCPAGVARVESSHSFANWLVSVGTIGVYTPMTLTFRCAGPGKAPGVSSSASMASGASGRAK